MNGIETLLQGGSVDIPPQLRKSYLGIGYGWAEFDLNGQMRDFAYADHFEERLSYNQNVDDIDEDESPCAGRVWDKGDGCQIFGIFGGTASGELFDCLDNHRVGFPHFHVSDIHAEQSEMEDIFKVFRLRNSRFGWAAEEKIKTRLVEHYRYACGVHDGALRNFCVDALEVYDRHHVCSYIFWRKEMGGDWQTTIRPKSFKKMCKQSLVRLHERARQKRDAAESFYRDLLLVYEKHGVQ